MRTLYIAPLAALVLPLLSGRVLELRSPAPSDAAPSGVSPRCDDDEDDDERELDVRDIAAHTKLTLRDAVARALAAHPGRAVEAELEGELKDKERVVYFDVMIVDEAGDIVEVQVNAASGATVVGEEEVDEEEMAELLAALRHSELDLGMLIERAGGFVKGVPIAAKLEFEGDGPTCEVAFANSRWVIEVELEARAGHLIELEIVPEHELSGRENDEADGDDDGDDEGDEDDEDEDDDEADDEDEDDDDDDDDDENDD